MIYKITKTIDDTCFDPTVFVFTLNVYFQKDYAQYALCRAHLFFYIEVAKF